MSFMGEGLQTCCHVSTCHLIKQSRIIFCDFDSHTGAAHFNFMVFLKAFVVYVVDAPSIIKKLLNRKWRHKDTDQGHTTCLTKNYNNF